MSINWKDLEEKGFVILKGALSADDLRTLNEAYHATKVDPNANYPIRYLANSNVLKKYAEQFKSEILPKVHSNTDIRADYVAKGTFFAVKDGVDFDWHSDHDSFYFYNDHYNYLNIYCPIQKPDPKKSNLCVIPFDSLKKNAPEAYEFIKKRGAMRVDRTPNGSVIYDDSNGEFLETSVDLEKVGYTPHLNAGDIMVMRGDTLHRTQDADTDRIATSFRVQFSTGLVTRKQFENPCFRKAIVMARNSAYNRRLECFDVAKADALPMLEYDTIYQQLISSKGLPPPPAEILPSLLDVLKKMDLAYILAFENVTNAKDMLEARTIADSLGACAVIGCQSPEIAAGAVLSQIPSTSLDPGVFIGVTDFSKTLKSLSKAGFQVIGADRSSSNQVSEVSLGAKVVFVINCTSESLTDKSKSACDSLVHFEKGIGSIRSMKVSAKGGILLHEALAQLNHSTAKGRKALRGAG